MVIDRFTDRYPTISRRAVTITLLVAATITATGATWTITEVATPMSATRIADRELSAAAATATIKPAVEISPSFFSQHPGTKPRGPPTEMTLGATMIAESSAHHPELHTASASPTPHAYAPRHRPRDRPDPVRRPGLRRGQRRPQRRARRHGPAPVRHRTHGPACPRGTRLGHRQGEPRPVHHHPGEVRPAHGSDRTPGLRLPLPHRGARRQRHDAAVHRHKT